MKYCKTCDTTKPLTEFTKRADRPCGYVSKCKDCKSAASKTRHKTLSGLPSQIYSDQKKNSTRRGHDKPEYSMTELREWLLSQPLYHELHKQWVVDNFDIMSVPSVDRLDDAIGYSFENIQLMSWAENKKKYSDSVRNNEVTHPSRPQIPVNQLDLDGNFIASFGSLVQAQRETGAIRHHIKECCDKLPRHKTANGFKWEYAE